MRNVMSNATLQSQEEPVFVNNHNVSVDVFTPDHHRLTVLPLALKARFPNATFEVKGEHYRQFTDTGSLVLFRNGEAAKPAPSPEEIRRVAAMEAANRDRQRESQMVAERNKASARTATPPVPQLDTETSYLIGQASPDATPQQRADLATYVLKKRAGDAGYDLPSSLASYKTAMDKIASGIVEEPAKPDSDNEEATAKAKVKFKK